VAEHVCGVLAVTFTRCPEGAMSPNTISSLRELVEVSLRTPQYNSSLALRDLTAICEPIV
jgi:hypothetical protein